jgi:hypothetical protein
MTPSGLGTVQTGTLTSGPQSTTFTGTQGQWVYLDSQDRTSTSLTVELDDPDNKAVFSMNAAYDAGPYQLPRSGTYTLSIKPASTGATGSYRFRLLDLTNGALALTLNSKVQGALEVAYKTDVYQFPGASGQRLYYDALETDFDNVVTRIVAPDGTVRYVNGNSDQDVGPFTLVDSGTYYLFFESNLPIPSTYIFRLLNIADQPPIQPGTPITATLNPGSSAAVFQYAATTGTLFFFDGTGPTGGGSVGLFGPNNETLNGTSIGNVFELTLSQTGTDVLVISGTSANPVPYAFQIYTPTDAPSGPQIISLTVGAENVLTWTSVSGKTYRVQFKPDLGQATWTDLAGDVVASGATASKSDTSMAGATKRFYRIMVVQ